MVRRTFENAVRKLIAGALPVAAALAFVGAAPAQAAPVQAPAPIVQQVAAPLQVGASLPLDWIATNPEAMNSDPLTNGAAAGAVVGATGSGVMSAVSCLPGFIVMAVPCAIVGAINGAVVGALVGILVGVVMPELVPQTLP
ncbi:hypothetical protein [Nocardia sp. bgisy134]|uniref:hypothetical protein n=1 Tax=Nocardia sp. bgisy134 TaxID=3413789 RepID=UPI003D74EC9F